jgi:hypothetical protein
LGLPSGSKGVEGWPGGRTQGLSANDEFREARRAFEEELKTSIRKGKVKLNFIDKAPLMAVTKGHVKVTSGMGMLPAPRTEGVPELR